LKISTSTLQLLQSQYAHENHNQFIYSRLATWCDFYGMTGTASFLRKQAKGEADHAEKVLSFIVARNEQLTDTLPLYEQPKPSNFRNCFEILYDREVLTTEKLSGIYKQAVVEYDTLTAQWLMSDSGLLKEQVEEENTIQTILDRIDARMNMSLSVSVEPISQAPDSGGALHDLDAFIGGL